MAEGRVAFLGDLSGALSFFARYVSIIRKTEIVKINIDLLNRDNKYHIIF